MFVILTDDLGHFLLVRRRDPVRWELPGGRVDPH
jgi:8-oxo-dGTP pyrophosphatase MutT (NUDIX family)